ncbi:MAG TPA: PINc/VapC family ATPase [Candidatus Nanoarchaeia archaeon]|nr:PINc/VapC family ATPase [Candidatus Nanoarchaeia archaeon]
MESIEKLVPDTSVIIEGLISKRIKAGEIAPEQVIIHEAVLAELEHQANTNRAIGFLGLEELDTLKDLSVERQFALKFAGMRPAPAAIRYAKMGEIDSLIRELAYNEDATLMTADKVQYRVAKAKGMKCLFMKIEQIAKRIQLEDFFDEMTMSVHLRENVLPYAKKGRPGSWEFIAVRKKELTRDEIQDISREIIEEAGVRKDGFIEIERPGSTIVQLGKFRIVVTKPPFSDGWEITAVRPVKHLSLPDYHPSEKLLQRMEKQAEGILIAGAPGMGKSTFAQALAEHYASQDKIVKTIEAPRDLVLPENVTQYAISHGDSQEIHDILLLSRPDYTIFDEMRNMKDFALFADLRLSGIGLAGVIHATKPIDAIQRFVGKIELGVIPHIVDTVIFIRNGEISKVLSLQMVVKVPSGMTEEDLARPVVVVNDFETNKLEYELYSYGEETVVVPVQESAKKKGVHELAARQIEQELRNEISQVEVEMVSDHKCIIRVPEHEIARIIGKQGKNIQELEKRLGMGIDVEPLSKKSASSKQNVPFNTELKKQGITFFVDHRYRLKDVDIYVGNEFLLTAKVGNTGSIQIHKDNRIGKLLADAITAGENVRLLA